MLPQPSKHIEIEIANNQKTVNNVLKDNLCAMKFSKIEDSMELLTNACIEIKDRKCVIFWKLFQNIKE